MNITIKPIEQNDENGKLIMEWRNDENTRLMSFDTEIKVWDKFKIIFYEKYYTNYVPPLFAYYNNIKIAFIGFIENKDNNNTTNNEFNKISINISKDYRNKGLGKIIIIKAIEYIKINYPLIKNIIAEIKSINTASIKVFEFCNFKHIENYKYNNIDICKYIYKI